MFFTSTNLNGLKCVKMILKCIYGQMNQWCPVGVQVFQMLCKNKMMQLIENHKIKILLKYKLLLKIGL